MTPKPGEGGNGVGGQALRFLASGAFNTAATYLLYLALQLVVSYQVAYAIAFVAGIALSYAINVGWVFRSVHTRGKALAYPLVYLAQYVLGALLLALLVETFGVPQELAPIAVILLTLPVTFLLSRRILAPRKEGP